MMMFSSTSGQAMTPGDLLAVSVLMAVKSGDKDILPKYEFVFV